METPLPRHDLGPRKELSWLMNKRTDPSGRRLRQVSTPRATSVAQGFRRDISVTGISWSHISPLFVP